MKRVVTVLALLAVGFTAMAQSAMPFIRIDRDPATAAMGSAQALSPKYNPAAVPFAPKSDFALTYQLWAPSSVPANHFNLVGEMKIGERMGFNIAAGYQLGQSYKVADSSGNIGNKEFTPTELVASAGFGFAFTDNLSAGLSVRYASQKLAEKAAYNAISADVFALYSLGSLKMTAGVAALGPKIKSGNSAYAQPSSAKLGASYNFDFDTSVLNLAADFDYYFAGGIGVGGGAEYSFKDMVFVRAGGRFANGSAPVPTHVSVGAGFKFAGIHLDACYILANQIIGNTLMAGLGYSF